MQRHMLHDISFKEEHKMNVKQGWVLLAVCFMCGFVSFFIFSTWANDVFWGALAAFVGFISPPIVYFGNRI